MHDAKPATAKPEKLLVVDGDSANRETLREFLEAKGYEVALAANSEQALDLVDRTALDLVLLGLSVPQADSLDVLKHLRGTFSPGELPVILVSPENDSNHVVEALTLGANDYISKPIEFGVAISRIKTQLARKKFENKMQANAAQFSSAADSPGDSQRDGLWTWNLDTNQVHYSASWKAIVGCVNGEVGGSHQEWLDRVHPEDENRVKSAIDGATGTAGKTGEISERGRPAIEVEHRLRRPDGSYVWVVARAGFTPGPGGSRCLAGSLTDITSRKTTDEVTGLPLESQFLQWIAQSRQQAWGGAAIPVGIAVFGVDRFQSVRGGLGEAASLNLLRHFAAGFKQCLAMGEFSAGDAFPAGTHVRAARLADSEFGVLILGCQTSADVLHFAHQLQQALSVSINLAGTRVYASLSAGLIPNGGETAAPAELLRDARSAMEQARSLGSGHVLTFLPQMRDLAVGRLELEHDLRNALVRKEFELYYQPQVHLDQGRLVGFEALLRWRHPRRGLVSPLEFIPLAEQTGLIVPIGDWALEQSCRQARQWQLEFPEHSQLTIGVNVSSKQLEPGLGARIAEILRQSGLAPACLALEITESALVSDGPEVLSLIEELRKQHIGLHIDDFGTGYSSLQYLQRLPFDTLKIDKSFVDRLGATRETTEITRAIIALARDLRLEVVSEGIETREQLTILRDFGSHVGQGYLFSRPLSREQAEELLRHGFEFDMEALLTPD